MTFLRRAETICQLKCTVKPQQKISSFTDNYLDNYRSRDMGVDINLTLIKIQELNRLGNDYRLPFEANSLFFRNIRPEK